MPDAISASAVCRTVFSSIAQPNAFQLLHPIGGLAASDCLGTGGSLLGPPAALTPTTLAANSATPAARRANNPLITCYRCAASYLTPTCHSSSPTGAARPPCHRAQVLTPHRCF